jgi:HAD superfamily hydrolase (TIGR01509 family)
LPQRQPLPGARSLIDHLIKNGITFGIATSGSRPTIDDSLNALQLPDTIPVSEGSLVENAKPAPDLFLKCSQMLKTKPESCYVVGDSVWDILAAKRAKMTGIALLTGGYGKEELHHAGAVRVYKDPEELKNSLFELISY